MEGNQLNKKQRIHRMLHFYLLATVILTLPFFVNFNSLFIILFAINWAVEGEFRQKLRRLRVNPVSYLFIGFFFLHIAGLLNSDNLSEGGRLIERKMSLLAFPLILATLPRFSKSQVLNLLLVFAGAVLAGDIFCLAVATGKYFLTGQTIQFFYHEFSDPLSINAIYLSGYTGFSLIILLFYASFKGFGGKWKKWLGIAASIIFICSLLLLSSKVFLTFFTMMGGVYILYLFYRSGRLFTGVVIVGLFLITVIISVLAIPQVKSRFDEVLNADYSIVSKEEFDHTTRFSGLSLRVVLWKMSLEILDEKDAWVFGVGLGNATDLLNKKYEEYSLYMGNPHLGDTGYKNYNVHSQYFQILLVLGITGLLFWLVILVLPLFQAFSRRNYFYVIFLLLIMFFSISEVFLNTHKGVVFYSLFNSLLFFHWFSITTKGENLPEQVTPDQS